MIGNRILDMAHRPPRETVEKFREVATAHAGDNMARLYGTSALRSYNATGRICGTAFTVKVRPTDNLLVHKAIAIAEPGDLIVVDGSGVTSHALVGELLMLQAKMRDIGGFVIDAAIRDLDAFGQDAFGCFARGVSHRGPFKDGPGEIGVPVSIGGMVVTHGDILIGDVDGLVAIPTDAAEDVLARVSRTQKAEQDYKAAYASGEYDRSWIDETLRSKGFEV